MGRTPCRRNGWITQNSVRAWLPKQWNRKLALIKRLQFGQWKEEQESLSTIAKYCNWAFLRMKTFYFTKVLLLKNWGVKLLFLVLFRDVENSYFWFCFRNNCETRHESRDLLSVLDVEIRESYQLTKLPIHWCPIY